MPNEETVELLPCPHCRFCNPVLRATKNTTQIARLVDKLIMAVGRDHYAPMPFIVSFDGADIVVRYSPALPTPQEPTT